MKVLALHGFLGSPQDFDSLGEILKKENIELIAPALTEVVRKLPEVSFSSWAREMLEFVRAHQIDSVLGYSLGGRLALELITREPLLKKAILISTNPGLSSTVEREQRLENDRRWASRLRHEPLTQVLRDWNSQDVFAHDPEREMLGCSGDESVQIWAQPWAQIMETFSLGRQKNHAKNLVQMAQPVLWIVGNNDKKFLNITRAIELPPHHQCYAIEGAGHRVPLTHPAAVAERVTRFFKGDA